MRILNVINTVAPDSGGPSESLRQVGSLLASRGHVVEVASCDPGSGGQPDFPLKVHALGPGSGSFGYSAELKTWLAKHAGDYDVLIERGLWQYHGIALREAARRAGKPYWVFSHGMLDPWFNRRYPLKSLKKQLFWPWQHAVLRDAQAVLFTCEEERILARQSFKPYRVREKVVSYGTARPPGDSDVHRKTFADAFPQTRGKRLLLYLGRIHPKKGCDLLISAFADLSKPTHETMLVMAGPDPEGYGSNLKELAASLGVQDSVLWPGMLRDSLKWGAFYSADAFILPSHQENFGIAVVEALSCGVPVLISKPVNIWREIEGDGAGYVEEDTLDGAKQLLRRWEQTDPSARATMAQKAVACYESRFTVEGAADSLLRVIEPQ